MKWTVFLALAAAALVVSDAAALAQRGRAPARLSKTEAARAARKGTVARSKSRPRSARSRARTRARSSALGRRSARPGIIATLGPGTRKIATLRAMLRRGMGVARINLSHGDARSARKMVRALERAAEAEGMEPPPLLFDLPGGKVRLGELGDQPVTLSPGATFELHVGGDGRTSPTSASVDHAAFGREVRKGDRLLLDDGKMELEVTSASAEKVTTKVTRGGELRSGLGVAIAGRDFSFPAMTRTDRSKLKIAVESGARWVGVSMVQNASNLKAVRRELERLGAGHIKLVAKIESHAAMRNLGEVIDHADMVMIARGDLVTVVGEKGLPRAQARIARESRARRKPFIVASNLMTGMHSGEAPTRRDRADVKRALGQRPGWLMLNETAMNEHPERVVKALSELSRNRRSR